MTRAAARQRDAAAALAAPASDPGGTRSGGVPDDVLGQGKRGGHSRPAQLRRWPAGR
jgi:hypothetical protein